MEQSGCMAMAGCRSLGEAVIGWLGLEDAGPCYDNWCTVHTASTRRGYHLCTLSTNAPPPFPFPSLSCLQASSNEAWNLVRQREYQNSRTSQSSARPKNTRWLGAMRRDARRTLSIEERQEQIQLGTWRTLPRLFVLGHVNRPGPRHQRGLVSNTLTCGLVRSGADAGSPGPCSIPRLFVAYAALPRGCGLR
ncbi:hypothetical protein BaRGS_00039507 [Batillaria attramentaria]|uniref:Uncharacterized protein n=1 Tax=Batillaria attramentaria TaxID=370345 RepID=A0ABD0J384_9CAEN